MERDLADKIKKELDWIQMLVQSMPQRDCTKPYQKEYDRFVQLIARIEPLIPLGKDRVSWIRK